MVSVVIPMRNEAMHIERCLRSLMEQDYPPVRFEVVVVDGESEDGSRDVVRDRASTIPSIRLCSNHARTTPFGLNAGIRASRGDVIVILGAHAFVDREFLTESVRALERSGAEVAGGVMRAIGVGAFGEAVAAAISSRFGVGRIAFRQGAEEGFVDTTAFAAYRRSIFERVGLFDEEMVRNQDDELNYRLRRHGGRIFLSPRICTDYVARSSPSGLWRQYFDYGLWKVRVLQKHPRVMQPRHFVPALSIAAGGGLVAAGLWDSRLLAAALGLAALYAIALGRTALGIARRIGWARFPHLLAAFPILHLAYGAGSLVGLVRFLPRWWKPEPAPPALEPAPRPAKM